MKTYEDKINELVKEAITEVKELIKSEGVVSEINNKKCLVIMNPHKMFPLDSVSYLSEINEDNLIDNAGYSHKYSTILIENFFSLVDYLKTEYSK